MNPSREAAPSERGLPAKPGGGVFRAEQGAGPVRERRRTKYSPLPLRGIPPLGGGQIEKMISAVSHLSEGQ